MATRFDPISQEEFLDIRLRLRLSQSKLGWILGLSTVTVNRLENGRASITPTISLSMKYLPGAT